MKAGSWVCAGLVGVALAGACGRDGVVAPAGEAGAGGQGSAGEPGERPTGCVVDDGCGNHCPTLVELRDDCDTLELIAYRSSCGGTYVEQHGTVTLDAWIFDAKGHLVGGSSEDEGGCSSWGAKCDPVGDGEPLCERPSECVEHPTCAEWGANFYCPEQVADVQRLCELGIDVESFASDCGGTFVHATNGIQDVKYSFDADGQLVGVLSWGDVGDCDQWGTHCGPSGAPEAPCGAGGAGGGASGGEGGDGEGGRRDAAGGGAGAGGEGGAL